MPLDIPQVIGTYTAEQAFADSRPGKVEVWEGVEVYMSPSFRRHNRVAELLLRFLWEYCDDHQDLEAGGQQDGFVLSRDPDVMYSPDAYIFRRRTDSDDRRGYNEWLPFAPELVIEVLSPSNTTAEMQKKRADFFAHGTEQFWVANPATALIDVFYSDGRHQAWRAPQVLVGEGIVAGLELPLAKIFAQPGAPAQA